MNNVFDRDDLVSNSPHQFTNVYVIFQKHNQGLNWRNLVLNIDVWILLCGYPFDRRNIQEVSNYVNKLGKFLMWDKVRSTTANLMVHVRVEELSDIPNSIVFGEGDRFQSGSLTMPVVILQQQILGEVPPDEDPIPPHGNPRPIPQQDVFHPNQHNHFLGPLQQHEHDDIHQPEVNHVNLQLALNNGTNNPDMMEQQPVEEEDEVNLPGWGHWAMPHDLIDQELHQGEFLGLNDIIELLNAEEIVDGGNANSSITISGGPTDNSASTDASANGPLAPMQPGLPDLNLAVEPIGLGPLIPPAQA